MGEVKVLSDRGRQQLIPVSKSLEPELEIPFGLDSPIRVLHRMIVTKDSGKISISDPHDPSILWQICIGNGQIHFATCLAGQRERLNYALNHAGIALSCEDLKTTDYQFLCAQWQTGKMTLAQLRNVLILITQDSLLQVLKLSQATIRIDRQLGLDPLLMSVPIVKLLSPILASLRQWQTVLPDVLSPLQRPVIQDLARWNQMLRIPGQVIPRLHLLQSFLGQNFCLYQIAQEMGVDLSKIVPLFRSLVQRELITMQPYHTVAQKQKPTIVCIDANIGVQANVKMALEPQGYEVVSLMEPTHVWSTLVQHQPQILLLDVDYFDGYSFVKALSRSERFKAMPVVALTEHQGIVRRLWARRSGVMDCLAKSFEPGALQHLVQQVKTTMAAA
jgi:twitching motility two-component system response regulator PilG